MEASVRRFICSGYACISNVFGPLDFVGKLYCQKCSRIRIETEASHRLEGHSEEVILMCPACEGAVA